MLLAAAEHLAHQLHEDELSAQGADDLAHLGVQGKSALDLNDVEPFITDLNDYTNKPNKLVKDTEVEKFYYQSFDKALSYCNRWNVDDLSQTELDLFLKGVCLLTASDLWNKYNIRVNNEDMEDTYVQSFGGLLYKQAVMILKSFINQRVTTLSSIKKTMQNTDGTWFE